MLCSSKIPLLLLFCTLVSSLTGCFFYEDNYQPQATIETVDINFPGIVNFQYTQSISRESSPQNSLINNELIIVNASSNSTISTLTYMLNIYSSEERISENLLFSHFRTINDLVYSDAIILSTTFDESIEDSQLELEIIEVSIKSAHDLNGIYEGTYVVTNKSDTEEDTLRNGNISGFVNFQGKYKLVFENQVDIKNIEGHLTADDQLRAGEFVYNNETARINSIESTVSLQNELLLITVGLDEALKLEGQTGAKFNTVHLSLQNVVNQN